MAIRKQTVEIMQNTYSSQILDQNFFNRPSLIVAQELLGKVLVNPKPKFKASTAHVYFIYGKHYCFNVVTEGAGFQVKTYILKIGKVLFL
jgi:3-methyladenine DNA glycosylase Mpg